MSQEFGSLRWENVRPVLVSIFELLQSEPPVAPTDRELAKALGRSPGEDRLQRQIAYLKDAGYLDGEWEIDQISAMVVLGNVQITEKGLQEAAAWPVMPGTDPAKRLLEVIEARLSESPAPETRSRLERLRDAVKEAGPTVVGEVLGGLAGRLAGG